MTTGGRFVSCLLLCACVSRPCVARVVINELYYDHPGTDTGHEFIELINTDSAPVDISDATIEFHNGTGTTWTLVWRAPAATTIAPDALFVIGGNVVVPLPDAVITYSLQNGPDAIRLVDAHSEVLDTVGYGGLDDPAFVETMGAAKIPAGKSIARALDGVDSDDNSLDFVAATPTPGRHNVARNDAALVLEDGVALRGARTRPGIERMEVRIENRGLEAIVAGDVSLELADSSDGVTELSAAAFNAADIPPGHSERVVVPVALTRGYHWLTITLRDPHDERDDNNRVSLLRRVGRIPILVSEVWSSPRDGCPQFVEWTNAGSEPVDVTGFSLRDERAHPVVLDADTLAMQPGEWIALAADPDRLAECVRTAPRERLFGVRGAWPTFNRSGGAEADSVLIFDRYGIVVDAVSYPAVPSASAGKSLERIDLFLHDGPAVWRLSDAAAGCSPAQPNRAFIDAPAPPGHVVVTPNPFTPSRGDLLHVAATPPAGVTRIDVWVYDIEGHRLAALGGTASFPALFVWDGRRDDGVSVEPGLYIVATELFRADGSREGVDKVVVGCATGGGSP
jgi:hypothetical protein